MLKKVKRLAANKKASMLYELLVVLFVLFAFLYSTVSFFIVFFQYETLTYAAKSLARNIEVTGDYSDERVQNNFSLLLKNSKVQNADYSITVDYSTGVDTPDESVKNRLQTEQLLQLGQIFTLRVTGTYPLELIGGESAVLQKLVIPVPFSYEVTGMSEVYWKE